MEIIKYMNYLNCYYYKFKKNNKILNIFYAGNLDLYMSLRDENINNYDNNLELYFDITKENYQIYELFEQLYNYIIEGNPFAEYLYDDNDIFDNIDYKKIYFYKDLVNENKNIIWISDNGPRDAEDKLIIKKEEDYYRLIFVRNDKPLDCGYKSPFGISIRFRNSGSYYAPYNCVFMNLYNKLNEIDLINHQIHFEELEYQKKLKKVY